MAEEPNARRFENLAEHFEVLASTPRLELLHVLRTPRELNEIRVAAQDAEGRPLSRQAITKHLDQLREAGLVHRVETSSRGSRGTQYALSHDRLFALVDEIRALAKIRPLFEEPREVGETLQRPSESRARLPGPPRLYVAYGRDDGLALPLHDGHSWRIGRSTDCEIALDYDPFLSAEHAAIEREGQPFYVRDLKSRNGTWLNSEKLASGARVALGPGDVITVGRSTLVFQS